MRLGLQALDILRLKAIMVSRDDLKRWLEKRPYQPVEIELTSGTIVPISHPELVMVSPTLVVVGIGSNRFGLTDYDVIGIDQIAKIRVAAGTPAA